MIALAVSVAVAILLSWAGWGYWALVAAAVIRTVSQTVGAWWLCRWIPRLPRRAEGTASMVKFATNVYGRFIVNYSARNLDNVLVGWRFEAQALGFYKKAYDLFALSTGQLVSPLSNVAVSALSRLNRDPVQYRRYLLRALGVTAFVGMGLGADLTLIGNDVIRFVLGPGWETSGRIFTYFGPGIGVMFLYYTHGWIHLSIGRADRWFRWGIVEFALTAALFVVALPWGPAGMAVAWTASFWILTVPAFWYAGRPIQLEAMMVVASVWKYLVASLLAGGACIFIIQKIAFLVDATGALGALLRMVVISLLFGVLYLGAVVVLHSGFGPLQQVVRLLKQMLPGSKSSGVAPIVAATREESVEQC